MTFCKFVNYLGWASGIFGGLLILAGIIGFILHGEFLGVANFYNFFFIANSFTLFGIFILLGTRCFCCCNCKDGQCCTTEGKEK